jgi:HAD superfamily phosphoserine phosphatase-like hydrolase
MGQLLSSSTQKTFIDEVVRLQPRLAVFDCDGTLWAGDSGEGFFSWELTRGVVSDDVVLWARQRYADYKAGKVSEDDMCAEMATLHQGLLEADVQRASDRFVEEYVVPRIFPDMRELVGRLRNSDCEVWAVSSTNEWVIRAAMKHCGIDEHNVLAVAVQVENGLITDRVLRVPSGEGKVRAIRDVIGRDPDAAFGNSRFDVEMLATARHAFAVNPYPDLETTAGKQNWAVYWPDGTGKTTDSLQK